MNYMNTAQTTTSKCLNCQMDDEMEQTGKTFEDFTQQQRNHWMMWGCTCTPEAEQAAMDYMHLVTR